MSLLHVLQEGGGPLEGGGLVGLCVAERDQEVQLVTTDADPAPAGKVEASHRADDTKQSSQASLCHSRDHSSGAQPECQDVGAPLKDCPNPLLTGQKPVSRPRIGSNPPESGAKPCVCGFVVSVKLMTGPHVPRTQSRQGARLWLPVGPGRMDPRLPARYIRKQPFQSSFTPRRVSLVRTLLTSTRHVWQRAESYTHRH